MAERNMDFHRFAEGFRSAEAYDFLPVPIPVPPMIEVLSDIEGIRNMWTTADLLVRSQTIPCYVVDKYQRLKVLRGVIRGISAAVEGVIEGVPGWTTLHGTAPVDCVPVQLELQSQAPALPEVDRGDRTGRGRSTGAEPRIWNPSQSDDQLKRKNAAATVWTAAPVRVQVDVSRANAPDLGSLGVLRMQQDCVNTTTLSAPGLFCSSDPVYVLDSASIGAVG